MRNNLPINRGCRDFDSLMTLFPFDSFIKKTKLYFYSGMIPFMGLLLFLLPIQSFSQIIYQEAETDFTYSGPGTPNLMPRSNASSEGTVWVNTTDGVLSWDINVPSNGAYFLVITYSNDNFGVLDTVSVQVDGQEVASLPFEDTESGIQGGGWNVFVNSPVIPLGILTAGTATLSLSLDFSNNGVEYDLLTISGTSVAPPDAPELVLPVQCAEDVLPTPLLTWAAVDGAIGYDIQLATDTDFATIIEQGSNLVGLNFQVAETLEANADYYWRVRVSTAAGDSPWSGQYKFTVANADGAPFSISEEVAAVGDTVCVSVQAQNYINIAAYQYSLTFDTSILEFIGIEVNANALADLSAADNFNLDLAVGGVITTIYDDTNGASASLADGTEIYKICFRAKALGTSSIAFANEPTPIFIFDLDLNVYDFMVGDGSVSVLPCVGVEVTIDTTICTGEGILVAGILYTATGVYENTLPLPNGCDSTIILNLTVDTVDFQLPEVIEVCGGEMATIEFPDGFEGGLSDQGPFSQTIVLAVGSHTIIVRDAITGCSEEQMLTIQSAPLPNILISGDTTFCAGTSTILIASGGMSYLWNTGEVTDTIVVDTAGIYTVTGTDLNGCVGIAEIEVTELPLPDISITGDSSFCAGGGGTLVASGGTSYLWSTGETTDTISVDTAGIYSVTGTGANGCVNIAQIQVTEFPLPEITITGDTSFCAGTSATLIATGGATYLWSTGETSDTIVVDTAGIYMVTGTDANGCVGMATIEVTELPLPSITITGDTSFCAGTSATLVASGGVSYLWNTGETSDTIIVDTAGIYTVTGTDANGCTGLAEIEVVELPLPIITIAGDTSFCAGTSATLIASGGQTYLWNTGETSDTIVVDTAGIYTVTGTDANGCVNIASIEVVELPLPSILITGDTSFCTGTSATLIASGGQTYLWSTGETSDTIMVDTAGIYTVTGTDANGCMALAEIEVVELPLPSIEITGDTSFCAGTSATLIASGGQTYLWSTGETSDTIVVDTAGIYTVTGTDANGCTGLAEIEVVELPLPNIEITGDTSFCAGTSVTLIASGGQTYLWNTGETSDTIVVDTAGIYTVTGTDANGCANSASIEVVELPLPGITITGDTSFCAGMSATLIASGGQTYLWSTGETSDTIVVDTAGIYSVTGTDANGCVNIAEIEVLELPLPTITIMGDTSFCAGTNATLVASGGQSYLWSTGETSETIVIDSAGIYSVTVTDENGCTNEASITIEGDTEAPNFAFCPSSASGILNFGMTEVAVSWPEPFVEDNCGEDALIITQSHFPGDNFGLGVTTVTYTAADAAGNTATCSFDVVVETSADLTFFVDTTDYTFSNDTFCVPIRVRSFEAVVGFQFTIVAPDAELSQIFDVEPLDILTGGNQINGFSFVMEDANTYRILWVDETGQGITLDDSTAVFNLKMTIAGVPGDCVPVGFSNDPLAIEAFQVGLGGVVPTVIGGDICVKDFINIEGEIFRINDEPIKDVEVSLFGPEVLLDITNPAGQYSFLDQIAGEDYTILPERDFNHGEGLSIIDLVLILRHIQLLELIENPYLLIAADVNNTMGITISDIVELQSLLLGNISVFTNNTSWRFIPTNYVFPNPAFPWQEIFPEQVDLIAQQTSIAVDFYGVKIGDINLSATGQFHDPFTAPSFDPFTLSIDNQIFATGDSFEVPVRASQIQDIAGLQLELGFDLNRVELLEVVTGNIPGVDPDQSFGYRYLEEGRLPFVWFQIAETPDLTEDPVLFTLRFKAIQAGRLNEVLYLNEQGENIAATQEVLSQRVELQTNALTTDVGNLLTNRFSVLSCSPNPFMEQTTIRFTLPIAESVQITVYDLSGKIVMADQKFFESGIQQWTVDAVKLGGSGMYTCQLQTAEGVEVVKIICQQ